MLNAVFLAEVCAANC